MNRFAALLVVLAAPVAARAGGLERPNAISARGVGLGGAWSALVDDATALYFNPGALATADSQVDVGGELVYGPRSYTPILVNGDYGPAQRATVIAPLPALGVAYRFADSDGVPSRVTLGAGVWNTFGGSVSFPKTGMPALDATEDAALEASAGASLYISDRLSVGAALRLGYGLFSVDSTQMPFDSHLSATGLGVGFALGALAAPTDTIRVGVTYRSPLHISTSGNGTVVFPSGPTQQQIEHDQRWPQQASLALARFVTPAFRLAGQIDWTNWASLQQLQIHFPATPTLDQTFPEPWRDSWTFRLGAEYAVSAALSARAGAYFDTAAVPDRVIERQYLDSNKFGLAAGASLRAASWRFDAAVDVIPPSTRHVPDNSAAVAGFPADANKAPGDYTGTLVTFEVAAAHPL